MKKLQYLLFFILPLTGFSIFGQTVFIREVQYDSPLAETNSIAHKGEFLPSCNYGDDSINITEDEIILSPDFEVKQSAELESTIEGGSTCNLTDLTIMTYNLGPKLQSVGRYKKHAKVIAAANADIVSLQEVRLWLGTIKRKTGLERKLIHADFGGFWGGIIGSMLPGGSALLWNKSTVGDPKSIKTTNIYNSKFDIQRRYSIAEFNDFYVLISHFATNREERLKMVNSILQENVIVNRQSLDKPIYIAGDLNAPRDSIEITKLRDADFEVLNDDLWKINGRGKDYIDLILEYNTNPNHRTIEKGVFTHPDYPEWHDEDGDGDDISDHRPYRVKVKLN